MVYRLPAGAMFACLFIAVIHACFSLVVFPHPVAREDLRRKVLALTEHARPALVFAGDSRMECLIDPVVIARAMKLEPGKSVNIAVAAGNSATALAVFREFGGRFAPNPILVISVSPHCVCNQGELHEKYNAEYYWSVGLASRLRELSVKDAIRATFAPERKWLEQLDERFHLPQPDPPFNVAGYRALTGPPVERAGDGYPETIARLDRWRCFTVSDESSTPWQRLRADIENLRSLGAQIVLFDAPDHPAFLARLHGTPEGDNYAHFRATLARMCQRMNVPLLRYTAADFGPADHDGLFWDGVHANAAGAELLARRVAADINRLISRGVLHIQRPPSELN